MGAWFMPDGLHVLGLFLPVAGRITSLRSYVGHLSSPFERLVGHCILPFVYTRGIFHLLSSSSWGTTFFPFVFTWGIPALFL